MMRICNTKHPETALNVTKWIKKMSPCKNACRQTRHTFIFTLSSWHVTSSTTSLTSTISKFYINSLFCANEESHTLQVQYFSRSHVSYNTSTLQSFSHHQYILFDTLSFFPCKTNRQKLQLIQ